ncbi:DNA polymerase delta subunit 2, partial [Lecanoromycetidae sp. Uapishka_2]
MADDDIESLLTPPSNEDYPTIERLPSSYNPLQSFDLAKGDQKHYQQQYGDMYFLRLAMLKPAVEEIAAETWGDFEIGGEKVRRVDRVLDVRQGELCWVAGTVYMDMPLKPNILDDISKDHWISAPPPREKYVSPTGQDQTMLEDESGRLRLIGTPLQISMLVTGCIIAVMGTENANGDFEIIDMKVPDLPRQPQRWERDEGAAALANGNGKKKMKGQDAQGGGKIAIVSGLGISGDGGDTLSLDLLMEYLLGEACSQSTQQEVGRISRLIIAGNSISEGTPLHARDEILDRKSSKKYGYDSAAYNPIPTRRLDDFLATLLPSMPITLLPGEDDPANVSLPQQPIHPAMFPRSRNYCAMPDSTETGWFHSVTNPWEGDVDGWRFMGNGGQPIDDVFKYVEGDERLDMMENLLRWRCGAPTAPDTLWCYPFQDKDQFVIEECPHVYFVGSQPRFESTVIEGPTGQTVRLIAVPKFQDSGEVVLLDMDTLEPEVMKFEVFNES